MTAPPRERNPRVSDATILAIGCTASEPGCLCLVAPSLVSLFPSNLRTCRNGHVLIPLYEGLDDEASSKSA